jgi:hypothetical protein
MADCHGAITVNFNVYFLNNKNLKSSQGDFSESAIIILFFIIGHMCLATVW